MESGYREQVTPTPAINPRKNWYGWKRRVKRVLEWPPFNRVVVLVARRVLEPDRARRLPVAGREVQGSVGGATFVMLDPHRCTVAKELFWGEGSRPRGEEHQALALITELAADADVLLDVGAYSGVFTLAAAGRNRNLEVHAFEIVPEVYRLLFDNCVRNDVLDRVTCHHVGLGIPGTSVVLPVTTDGSSLPTSLSSRTNFTTGVRVRLQSLDSLVPLLSSHGRLLMKVDVEGTENELFEHGQRVLERFRPDILCEVLATLGVPRRLEELLAPYGYRFYLVTAAGLCRLPRIEPHRRFRDWFFTTRPENEIRDVLAATGGVLEGSEATELSDPKVG